MAVYTTGGGGGFLGSLAKIAQIGSMFVPGMQPWAAAIGAGSALANGDPVGAAISAGSGIIGNQAKGAAVQAAPQMSPVEQAIAEGTAMPARPLAAPVNPATGNPRGGLSAVSNMGINQEIQPNVSLAGTFSRLLQNPSSQMGRMFSNPWERTHYMNQRRF
jgi:hypothetical protein